MTSATYDGTGQKFGQAALSGGYGAMPATAIGTSYPFTVECFAKATITPTAVGYIAAQSLAFGIGVTASATYQFIVAGTTVVTSSPVVSGSWNHLALVATSTLATMYVNGAIAGTLVSPGAITNTNTTYIHSQSTTTNPFLGDVQEVAFWMTAKYTATFAPPTTAYAGSEGMLSLYHLGGSGADYAFTAGTNWIPATSSSIVYSPYNWWVTNIGAYTTNAEVKIKSTSATLNRYSHPSKSAVILQGIQLATGSSAIVAPATYPKHILVYGDAFSEGYYSVNSTAANDTDSHDASTCYAGLLCEKLNAEYGIVAYAGSGWATSNSTTNSPALTSFYGYLNPTTARTFSPTPDLIIINMGQSDWANSTTVASTQTAVSSVLTSLLAATPSTTKIIILEPFNADGTNITLSTINGYTPVSYAAAAIPSAITSTTRVTYLSTAGMFNANYGQNGTGTIYSPTGANQIGQIVPQLVNAILPVFQPAINKYTHS
jgi:hypothetical protein